MSKVGRTVVAAALVGVTVVALASACGGPDGASSDAGESKPDACGLAADTLDGFVSVPAGAFRRGRMALYPEERPHPEEETGGQLHIDTFSLLSHEVTNAEFAAFVDATDYVTDAERGVDDGRPDAGSAVFRAVSGSADPQPWALVRGASWRAPEGPGSDLSGRELHPVVHVSLNDARAYATWAGGRLPTEAELEYAMSLGLPDAARPTSGATDDAGRPRANIWQGMFPFSNTGEDGFFGSAPVGCFGADRLGAYDLIGNVWEWTETPYGPGSHAIKGGSFLCAENFCRRFRPAARQPQETDFSASHIGFRIVRERADQ
ncbi:MAG: SUMF1/EgtB/PvdO family nonheme iron enzyme [Alphaproteobacteria bacterium]|nr:SUMF1/EgtB/PvdO family nonheme iron enzyme [Alphaproteobacteria bacterium]